MAPNEQPLTKKQIIGLLAMSLCILVVTIDFTAFTVVLPAMEKTFRTDVATIQWVINGYTVSFGIFIVTGGRLADTFGRRRVYVVGAVIFGVFSLLAGSFDNIWLMLSSRAIMGIGGAMMWPATLGMTYALLPANRAGLAGGLVIGMAGLGNASGPLIGGFLTDVLSWHWMFFVNVPIAALGVLVILLVIDKDEVGDGERRIDYAGIAVLTGALLALLIALNLGTDRGWTAPLILGLFAASAVGLVAFGVVERAGGARALTPADVIHNGPFRTAALTILMMSPLYFGVIMYVPQFMAKQLHYSAVESGIGFLPMMLTFAVISFIAGNLYERLGAKASVAGGAAFLAVGIFLLSRLHTDTHYLGLVPGMVVFGVGVGLFYSSATTAGISALDPSRASLGGAIVYMFQVAGGAVGLATNTAIVVSAPSLVVGIRRAFLLNAILSGIGVVIALVFIKGRKEHNHWRFAIHRHRPHA